MQCPKCGFEQPSGTIECIKCGVIVAKALKSQQASSAGLSAVPSRQPAAPARSSQPETPAGEKPVSLVTIITLLVIANVILWWINFPPAGKIPENAYVNMKHQFALSTPSGWMQITAENAKNFFEENKDRFPEPFRDLIKNSFSRPGLEVGFVKVPDTATDFNPSLNVVVVPLQMPPLSESERDKAFAILVTEMQKSLSGYSKESASLIDVDGLTSLEIVGTVPVTYASEKVEPIMETGAYGRSYIVGYKPAVTKNYKIKLRQIFVPGKKRSYLITFSGEAEAFDTVAYTFNSVLQSFRVLQRPPRFGPIVRNSLNGALFGLCAYLIYLFIRRFSGRSIKI